MNEQPAEFYGSVQIVPESDPATDPLLTVRMQPPNTQARRLDPTVPRVVKVDTVVAPWVGIGPAIGGHWLRDDVVRGWPVQDPITVGVAMDRLAGKAVPPPASAPAAELIGDMGVESFRGGEA